MIAMVCMEYEPTNSDILEALQEFAGDVDGQFQEVRNEIGGLKMEMGGMNARLTRVEAAMVTKEYLKEYVDSRFSGLETKIVTKGYLDEKFGAIKGDMVRFVRAENAKILAKLS